MLALILINELQILHVMTANLSHAQRILAAALNAGFRESGVQSLKALQDDNACPMVAVRTAGLALSSVIGVASSSHASHSARSIVSEEYLRMMLALANERFTANTERVERFCKALKDSSASLRGDSDLPATKHSWESKGARAERKRQEGLARQEAIGLQKKSEKAVAQDILDSSTSFDVQQLTTC